MKHLPAQSLWDDAWYRFTRNKLAIASLIILSIIVILCIAGPLLSPYEFSEQDRQLGAIAPSAEHWLGTDIHGRDLFTRVLHGGRMSFLVGVVATLVSLTVGVSYGIISGYIGGKVDSIMMRIIEIIYALPFAIFVILLMVFFGRHLILMFVAIGMVEWLTMARIVRGQVITLRNQQFVEASRNLGQSAPMIMCKHLLPNTLGLIIIYATLTIPNVMLLEAFISFLGLGVQPPDTTWGDLIKEGADAMETQPWRLIFPSIAFSLTLFSLNFLGDGLRDALDPRSNKS